MERALSKVAAALSEASLQPDGWPTALSLLNELCGAQWSLVGLYSPGGRPPFLAQDSAGEPDLLEVFARRYTVPETNPSIPLVLKARQGTVVLRERHITDADWRRSEFYREIYRPRQLFHGTAICALSESGYMGVLGINRTEALGRFTNRDVALMQRALPHVRGALRVAARLGHEQASRRAHEAVWDSIVHGVVLVDDTGRVSWMNRAAQSILERVDGLVLRRGFLAAASHGENLALRALIDASVAASGGHVRVGGTLSVSRLSRLRPFALMIRPLPAGTGLGPTPAAVVFIGDPEIVPEYAPDLLKRLYGFTNREAALAALLVRGVPLQHSAQELHITLHTARTHLKEMFRKTQTRRQSEFIAHLLRGPLGLR